MDMKKINVVQVIETSGPGGAESVVLNIAKNLNRERYDSSVVLHRPGWFYGQLLQNNIKAEVIHSKRSWDISFIIRFINYCRKLKADIIHSHLSGANLYSCVAGWILRIPVIATYHNELYMPQSREKYVPFKVFVVRNLAAATVVVARYMQKDYIEKGKFSPHKLMTIYNGISFGGEEADRSISELKKELGLQLDDILVGNVANIRPPKGHKYLVEAAGMVCRDMRNVKFLLIGEPGKGELRNNIEKHIADLNLKDNVIFLGFREDIPKLLQMIDIFVLASTSEGLPLSIVEAMAAAKPVVATNVGGLSEIVIQDKTGCLVEPANSAALAEKLSLLIKSEILRKQMGEEGKKIAKKTFSTETMIDAYQNLYENLLS